MEYHFSKLYINTPTLSPTTHTTKTKTSLTHSHTLKPKPQTHTNGSFCKDCTSCTHVLHGG